MTAAKLVTLEELAARLGLEGNPAEYVTELGYEVHADWQGAAAVTATDAATLVRDHDATHAPAVRAESPTVNLSGTPACR